MLPSDQITATHQKTTLKSVAAKSLIMGATGLVAGIAVSLVAVLSIYDVAGESFGAYPPGSGAFS